MDQIEKQKLMTQILIGSAWIDHTLAPSEKQYLETILDRYDLGQDQEIQQLLSEPTPAKTTEKWLVQYLRHATNDERMQLLAKIGNVLIADDTVSDVEHDLLDDYHDLMARISPQTDGDSDISVTEEIGKAAQKIGEFVIDAINRVAHS